MLHLPVNVLQCLRIPKSTKVCYVLWAIGIIIGLPLHLLYLGHYRQAALWMLNGVLFGDIAIIITILCDVYFMPYYVTKANEDVPPQQKIVPASPLMTNIRCVTGRVVALQLHMVLESLIIPDNPSVIWYVILSPLVAYIATWLVAGVGYGKITSDWMLVHEVLFWWIERSDVSIYATVNDKEARLYLNSISARSTSILALLFQYSDANDVNVLDMDIVSYVLAEEQ